MAATRVRLSAEYRNGDWNFLSQTHGKEYVPCKGKNQLPSLVTAFLVLCDEIGFSAKEVHEHLDKHKPPQHD